MTRFRGLPVLVWALSLLAAVGCGAPGTAAQPAVTVYAAASLQRPFTELGELFEAEHPGAVTGPPAVPING